MMVRKFTWNTDRIIEVKDIILALDNGVLCTDDEINLKVEGDYSTTITYKTDEDNDTSNAYILNMVSELTGLEGDVEEYEE